MTNLLMFTRADSIGSVILRGIIWLIAVLILAYGVEKGSNYKKIKADAGWFFVFLFGAGILSYTVFGFVPTF